MLTPNSVATQRTRIRKAVVGVSQAMVFIGLNCASSAGVNPSMTHGLHEVTV